MITNILLFFAFVTLSHAAGLVWVKRHQKDSLEKREHLWKIHWWWNGILWFALFLAMVFVQWDFIQAFHPLWTRTLGWFIFLGGFSLSVAALFILGNGKVLLGYNRAMGSRFFFPENDTRVNSSIYRYLNNPMYDGLILVFVGAWLITGAKENLYLALASFFLLNFFLAWVENYEWKWNRF